MLTFQQFDVGFYVAKDIWTRGYSIKCIKNLVIDVKKEGKKEEAKNKIVPQLSENGFKKLACCEFRVIAILVLTMGAFPKNQLCSQVVHTLVVKTINAVSHF